MDKVLIVDDSETVRKQFGRALHGAGLEVLEACDGLEGLELIDAHRDLTAVVLDVNMPCMNGLDMLEKLRENPANASLAVIILTTEAQRSLVERARAAGARAWLIKPVKTELLLDVIGRLSS
jgi:two-component system chemotaxis response regulator CheY